MAKHRRHKEYTGRYDEFNDYTGYNDPNGYTGYDNNVLNKLSSILGNIDINQITSLLNAIGTFNKSDNSTNMDNSTESKKESDDSYNSDINLFELVSQAKAVNDMIMNENAGIYNNEENESDNKESDNRELDEENEDERNKHSKKKSRKDKESRKEPKETINQFKQDSIKNTQEQSNDPVVTLLRAMQPLIVSDKAEIINKMLKLYMEGKI
ncbi:hypothetical protein [Clostridium botulinum]|uniref:Uncharacterized protein n=1 Tax=Clostridium botulinum TaxID=1491 RepID=A0A9Q1UZ03_CLOBO|nr:hypothetical protein [Clostridium botulinum]AEB76793.1 hypothetical protein CbC4_2128 [Clostridium botulinum BKT015925]KEI02518.1 hypothetical protein Y848_07130 [Clostridium botulinum C/D str. Sp77]KEI02624.1 hypothetical protein Z953_06990 [Clostridium botulinum D str. 16868]KLU74722.1 hypothetical protein CBC3_12440 [Clostridium botulinum V891]KOA76926.1 hypothetical protein ADU78_05040 [Clostridium botulinum]